VHYLNLEPLAQLEGGPPPQDHTLSETLDIIWINEPTEALYNELTSERQWDYLEQEKPGSNKKGGKGKVKPPPANQVAKDDFGKERSNELPDKSTDANPFSKEAVRNLLEIIAKADQDADTELKKLVAQKDKNDEIMKDLLATGDLKKKK
jgi:YEATS domain-containing protein 4